MNYNTYPVTSNTPEKPNDAETAYREELCGDVVEASTGTVGVYASIDLNPQDKTALTQSIKARNPNNNSVNTPDSRGGGWGDYGEHALQTETHELLKVRTSLPDGLNEQVSFVDQPDGTTKVGYVFTSDGYKDGTGRPGNALNVGFTLPADKANELQQALQADPSYMEQVLKAQMLDLGFTEKHYQSHLEPRFGFRNHVAKKDRVLVMNNVTADGHLVTDTLTYGENKSILPEVEPAIETFESVASTEVYADQDNPIDRYDDYFNESLQLLYNYANEQRANGVSEQDIFTALNDRSNELRDEVRDYDGPEDENAVYNSALSAAYMNYTSQLEEQLQQQAAADQHEQERASEVAAAQTEVMESLAKPEEVVFSRGDHVIIAGEPMQVVETYLGGDGTTNWLVVRGQTGTEKHVMATKATRAS